MTSVTFGNHSAVVSLRSQQDRIRRFYRDVFGCTITRETDDKDDIHIGENYYIGILHEAPSIALDDVSFSKATSLELKTAAVEELRQRIVDFGVKVIPMRDSQLYFQAPGGTCYRLLGSDEDLSMYEGTTDNRQRSGKGRDLGAEQRNCLRRRASGSLAGARVTSLTETRFGVGVNRSAELARERGQLLRRSNGKCARRRTCRCGVPLSSRLRCPGR